MKQELKHWLGCGLLAGSSLIGWADPGSATNAVEAAAASDSGWLDIDQLSRVKVISVSRQPQEVKVTAAAVSVITGEDIRRSGATSIPEALRQAPGVDVARINANRYAVGIRGFNNEFADKLLVLMDGRSVYTPQFSGVFWDMQDVVLEDVDRIEVVRGPGGTAWGANAFNGVVNVVSKSAKDTQGTLATASGGSFDPLGTVGLRYGDKLGEKTWFRVFAKGSFHGDTVNRQGVGWDDDWNSGLGGFRIDSEPSLQHHATLLGGVNYAEPLQYFRPAPGAPRTPDRFQALGGHLLGRWEYAYSEASKFEAQVYYDAVRRNMRQNSVNTDTADVEVRQVLELGSRNQLRWGVNYRFINSRPDNYSTRHVFIPATRNLQQGGLSVEDQFTLVPERLEVAAGCKLEYYSLADWEPLPSARLNWNLTSQQTLWASVSRGVRVPSTSDTDLHINEPFLQSIPNPDWRIERVRAFQAGYRGSLGKRFGYDLTGFINQYEDLQTIEMVSPGSPPATPPTYQSAGLMRGEGWGCEASVTWQSFDWWRWRAQYSYMEMDLRTKPGSTDTSAPLIAGRTPSHQAQLWWSFQPARNVDLDAILRFTDELPTTHIPAYWGLDLRIAYRPKPSLEFALVGQNLIGESHQEMGASPGFPGYSEIPRSVYGKVTWKF